MSANALFSFCSSLFRYLPKTSLRAGDNSFEQKGFEGSEVAVTGAPSLSLRDCLFPKAEMSLSCNADPRKQLDKVTVDALEARRKPEENMVQIRKCRREEMLVKKRRNSVAAAPNNQPSGGFDQTISLDENVNSLTVTW